MLGHGPYAIPPVELAKYAGFPSDDTLRNWIHEALNPTVSKETEEMRGREPALIDDELEVVGGFVLLCAERHQPCSIHEVREFMEIAFKHIFSDSYISKHLHTLGFSAHRPASLKYTFGGVNTAKKAVDFLREYQPLYSAVKPPARILAMDQISIYDNGVMASTYSLINGYDCCGAHLVHTHPFC